MKLKSKTTATLMIALFMISAFAVAMPVSADFEYSYSESIDIEGSDYDLVLTVTEDDTWVTWTFDFPVETFTGEGNLNVGLIIALDGDGAGPAYQIHNNDGATDAYPVGTWLMSPWGPTIEDGWVGWHSSDTNTLVTDLDWVEASGLRNTPWTGVVPFDGVMTISIKRAVLGNDFHWAASPTVGSGFWEAYDVTMQVPPAFDWGTPLVTMSIPNYVCASTPDATVTMTAEIVSQFVSIVVNPATVDFGSIIEGSSGSSSVFVTNHGNVDAKVTAELTDDPSGLYATNFKMDSKLVAEWSITKPGTTAAFDTPVILTLGIPLGTPPGIKSATLVFWAEIELIGP